MELEILLWICNVSSDDLVTVNKVFILEFVTVMSAGWSGREEVKVHSSSWLVEGRDVA